MLLTASVRLAKIDIEAACGRAGFVYSPEAIEVVSFGQRIAFDPQTWQATPAIDMWQHLPLLQYLEGADGAVLGNQWIGMGELPEGGLARGSSFDRDVDRIVAEMLSHVDPKAIVGACGRLSGRMVEGRGDLSAVFCFAPRFPLLLNLWFADDEFPASGKVLVNDAVKHQLGTEAIGTVAVLLARRLGDCCK